METLATIGLIAFVMFLVSCNPGVDDSGKIIATAYIIFVLATLGASIAFVFSLFS